LPWPAALAAAHYFESGRSNVLSVEAFRRRPLLTLNLARFLRSLNRLRGWSIRGPSILAFQKAKEPQARKANRRPIIKSLERNETGAFLHAGQKKFLLKARDRRTGLSGINCLIHGARHRPIAVPGAESYLEGARCAAVTCRISSPYHTHGTQAGALQYGRDLRQGSPASPRICRSPVAPVCLCMPP